VRRHFKYIAGTVFLLIWAGCRPSIYISPETQPDKIKRTGYVIQAGAFSVQANAVRLTENLAQKGLNPYYFRHESGLYKVRFGDFVSRKKALNKALELYGKKIINDYYIVHPEEYAAVKSDAYGTGYLRERLIETAESFIGIEYSWGGSSRKEGFDCSGLTMAVYKLNGLSLPRSSRRQFHAGIPVKRNELEKGDLVFFAADSSSGKVTHVGIYIGNSRFIHAPGRSTRVRVGRLQDPYFKESYLGARRYF